MKTMKPIKEMRPSGLGGRRRGSTAVFLLALVGVTLAALGHVAVQAKTVEVALLLGQERARHEELIARQRQLELEVGALKDPGRLMAEGQKRGMVATPAAIRSLGPRQGGKRGTP